MMMQLKENTTFDNHYTLIRQLGRGGFSEVWLAHDSYMDIDVAIKIYAPGQGMDSNSINEFRREITGVFQLNHPNLLCPKHLGIWENMPYLIMAYCPAGSCLKFVGNISESEIWHLIHDVAAGLAYLHEKDIVHQDIKPDNILIDTESNYLITDFGISTRARSTLRKSVMSTHTSAGTLAYMGPERFSEQPAPTKASDIWSLGAMVYELLEGTTPFPPDFGGSMLNAGAAIPAINTPVSEKLKQTIYKMLSKETWDRPTAATLFQWARNPSAVTTDTPKSQPTVKKNLPQAPQPSQPKSKRWIWLALGLFILAGLGVLGIRDVQRRQIAIVEQEQRYQDSIRQIQIQDSLREVRRQDSIRVEQERIRRNDSIATVQAEQLRLQKEEYQRKENERKRLEQVRRDSIAQEAERKRIAEEKRIQSLRGVHNGHEYVDLGLSVKWATCNVGARTPEGSGHYFMWGCITEKTSDAYIWFVNGSNLHITKYVTNINNPYQKCILDGISELTLSDDVARAKWGGEWRMPTYLEFQELYVSCYWTWTNLNNIEGYLVTSKNNGNSIFLPISGEKSSGGVIAAQNCGRYWSSSLYKERPDAAIGLHFRSGYIDWHHAVTRSIGRVVRPVMP